MIDATESKPTRRTSRKTEEAKAYICGRPPYGYRVVDGRLHHQTQQQEAVQLAFKMAERGSSLRAIVEALVSKYGRSADGKAQFWDRVKLKRIWGHVKLYTKGEYTTSAGQVLSLPELAFMAEEYAKVPYPSPPVRLAAAMAAVPSRSGKGKMAVSPASSTRRKS